MEFMEEDTYRGLMDLMAGQVMVGLFVCFMEVWEALVDLLEEVMAMLGIMEAGEAILGIMVAGEAMLGIMVGVLEEGMWVEDLR